MASSSAFEVAVLDTCLLDYAFKAHTSKMASGVIDKINQTYTPVISEYLRFEIYRGLAMDRIPAAKTLVDSFTALPVDKATLDTAAALTTCLERDQVTKSRRSSFSDGDIILAATAFMHRLILVTANRSDFPAPYFNEIGVHKFMDKKQKPWTFYELKPDISYFNAMLEICYPKTSTAKISKR